MPPTVATKNLGLLVPTTGNPDFAAGGQATSVSQLAAALSTVDAAYGNVQRVIAAGAITVTSGTAILNTGAASAITLASPVAGLPAAGGNDGQELDIVAADAFAYTVTTPTNGINASKHIATWTAAVGNSLCLVAYGGSWYTNGSPSGVTLS